MQLARAARIILVGAPGVGKGTQSERLLQRYPQLSSVASGELLRNNVRKRTPIGEAGPNLSLLAAPAHVLFRTKGLEAQKIMSQGALVPDAMILKLIVSELSSNGWLRQWSSISDPSTQRTRSSDDPSASFILDGFPRNAGQASKLDELVPINLVVHIDTPTDIILDRIANRWVHAPSGRVYNTTFNPPKIPGKDDVTGESLTRREDDSPETWKKRLQQFDEGSMPLLEHYAKQSVLWRVQGNSSDEISPKLFAEFDKRFGAAG